jgi:hypothetical protein
VSKAGDISKLVTHEEEEEVSYLREVVFSQASIVGVAGAVAIGAVLSIPLGVGIGAIPVIAAAAAQSLAALFLPSSPVFRAMIDRRKRKERREQRRERLLTELRARTKPEHPHWGRYERMMERGRSLWSLSERGGGGFDAQMDSLAESTVDFLGLWLALLAMEEHLRDTDPNELERRLRAVDKQLEEVKTAVDRKHLEKAKADLEAMLRRRESLRTRTMTMDTAMLSMASAFEEVYQRVVAQPGALADLTAELDQALDELRVEEELDLAVDGELDRLLASRRSAAAQGSAR